MRNLLDHLYPGSAKFYGAGPDKNFCKFLKAGQFFSLIWHVNNFNIFLMRIMNLAGVENYAGFRLTIEIFILFLREFADNWKGLRK